MYLLKLRCTNLKKGNNKKLTNIKKGTNRKKSTNNNKGNEKIKEELLKKCIGNKNYSRYSYLLYIANIADVQ